MKKLSSLKLSSIIFGIFMLLPMFSILSRVIYIQSNPNSKDSYYGDTINETQYEKINDYNELNNHNYTYQLILNSDNNTSINGTQLLIYSSATFISGTVGDNTQTRINNSFRMILYYSNDSRVIEVVDNNGSSYVSLTTHSMVINIENPTLTQSSFEYWKQYIYRIEYNDYSYLDNVFDYSLHTFLEDDNNYSINFFDFFGNTFLNLSGKNMLYLNFLNWYMNYGLLVSSGYILFFVLYFFINVIRKLVLSFTNKIDGGF